jgi:hypothetical protein
VIVFICDATAGASHNGPKTSVKDSTKFLGFLGGLLRQSIRCEDRLDGAYTITYVLQFPKRPAAAK